MSDMKKFHDFHNQEANINKAVEEMGKIIDSCESMYLKIDEELKRSREEVAEKDKEIEVCNKSMSKKDADINKLQEQNQKLIEALRRIRQKDIGGAPLLAECLGKTFNKLFEERQK